MSRDRQEAGVREGMEDDDNLVTEGLGVFVCCVAGGQHLSQQARALDDLHHMVRQAARQAGTTTASGRQQGADGQLD